LPQTGIQDRIKERGKLFPLNPLSLFEIMSDPQIEEIKERLNIVDVVQDYLPLKKSGVNFKARCPFHEEKTASFYVTPSRQIWHCFGCSLGGDVIEFVKQIESMDFPQALELLAERAGVQLQRRVFAPTEGPDKKQILFELNDLAAKYYHKVLLESKAAQEAREYLSKRKFLDSTIAEWKIGYSPDKWSVLYDFLKKKGYKDSDMESAGLVVKKKDGKVFDRFRDRIMFPIADLSGRAVGFSARILHPREDVGKYINSAESEVYSKSKILFGLFQARNDVRKSNAAVIVEGNVDVVKSHQAGIKNVAGSSGTALTESQLRLLSRFTKNLLFAFDADAAGSDASRRALELAISQGFNVKQVSFEEGVKDPDEAIDRDPDIWRTAIASAEPFLDFYFKKLFDILDLTDATAKKQSVASFLTLLSRVSDPIVQSHYIKMLSEKIQVREEVILGLLKQHRLKQAGYEEKRISRVKANPKEILEQRFIGLLFSLQERMKWYVEHHEVEHFQTPKYREIFQVLKDQLRSTGDIKQEEFINKFSQVKVAVEVARFAIGEEQEKEQIGPEMTLISKRLLKSFYERQTEELSGKIRHAEEKKDLESVRKYSLEYNQVIQKKQEAEN